MDKTMKLIILLIAVVAVVLVGVLVTSGDDDTAQITNYEECVAAGYPIMESYPEQCAVPDGPSFTRVITDEEQAALTQPAENVVAPENYEETTLSAVGAYTGTAIATRSYTNAMFQHEVIAQLGDPAEGKFYEGWLVTPDLSSVISTGKLVKEAEGEYSLSFTADTDLRANVDVVITEETLANGLDGVPEAHVLEGSF